MGRSHRGKPTKEQHGREPEPRGALGLPYPAHQQAAQRDMPSPPERCPGEIQLVSPTPTQRSKYQGTEKVLKVCVPPLRIRTREEENVFLQ